MIGADAIAHILELEGIDTLTCFPHNLVIDAVAARGVRPILARTERIAINMAEGYSRMNAGKKLAAAAVQDGPGVENAFGAVAQAYGDNSPVLVLPGSYPRDWHDIHPNFQAVYNYQNITKWVAQINSVDRIPAMMRRAMALLRSGRPGPIVLEVPYDVMTSEFRSDLSGYRSVQISRPAGDPEAIKDLANRLRSSQRPVIYAGQGVLYAQATAELVELAELLDAPVMTSLNGKSSFPEHHALSLGVGGNSKPEPVKHFLERTDFVLAVGTSLTVSTYITPIPKDKVVAQITVDEADVSKDYPVDFGVIGDAQLVLQALIAELKEAGPFSRGSAQEIGQVRHTYMQKWLPRLTSDKNPIGPLRLLWDLMHTVDRAKTVITHEAGTPRDQMSAFYETRVPHGYIGWGKTTQLGTSLGLTMGAKLARPDWLAINIMGDGAFGMVGMDFETAVRCQIPILTIVLNNGVLGQYDFHLPVSTERYGTRNLSGDYAGIASALGGYTEKVNGVVNFKPALLRAIAEVDAGRPALLDVKTREESHYPK
jgi:acetolactate synthase-1/2/3 large subunit